MGIKNYRIEVSLNCMTLLLSFMKIFQSVQKLLESHTDKKHYYTIWDSAKTWKKTSVILTWRLVIVDDNVFNIHFPYNE
jgi:hypothetical protein